MGQNKENGGIDGDNNSETSPNSGHSAPLRPNWFTSFANFVCRKPLGDIATEVER